MIQRKTPWLFEAKYTSMVPTVSIKQSIQVYFLCASHCRAKTTPLIACIGSGGPYVRPGVVILRKTSTMISSQPVFHLCQCVLSSSCDRCWFKLGGIVDAFFFDLYRRCCSSLTGHAADSLSCEADHVNPDAPSPFPAEALDITRIRSLSSEYQFLIAHCLLDFTFVYALAPDSLLFFGLVTRLRFGKQRSGKHKAHSMK
jgi:hypothetical protein